MSAYTDDDHLYLVMGSTLDGKNQWPVCVYENKLLALEHADGASSEARSINNRFSRNVRYPLLFSEERPNIFDPQHLGKGESTYFIEKVLRGSPFTVNSRKPPNPESISQAFQKVLN